jgi:tRNA A-37 threonylcarbamoyl transferase component Bud32
MHSDAEKVFSGEIKQALLDSGSKLLVLQVVIDELKKLCSNQDIERRKLAQKGYEFLLKLNSSKLVELRGGEPNKFVDNMFQQFFMHHRVNASLSLITQDVSLMVDLLELQTSNSVQGIKPITIWEIQNESLVKVDFQDAKSRLARQKERERIKRLCNREPDPTPLSIRVEVSVGSRLNHSRGDCVLEREIGSGGEGKVFATSISGIVAKIYKPEKLTKGLHTKLQCMLVRGLDLSGDARGICWPLDILTDEDGVFRGYLMHEAMGTDLGVCVFIRPELERHFPYWNRRHLVTLCINLLKKIRILHDNDIIIGDINPYNIRVEDETSIFFVDTDSYQIGKYPCPVGFIYTTPPELQQIDFSKIFRTHEHEAFAIATMLFMILHAGKQPYAQLGGGTNIENIRNMRFPYPLGERSERTAPEGPWKYIWSHLTYKMKEAFYETFHESYQGQKRRTVGTWISILEEYAYTLDKGFTSNELFPSNYKQISTYAEENFRVGKN